MAESSMAGSRDESLVGEVEQFIREAISALEPEGPRGPGRPRILPALCLWAGLLVCVLRGFSSQLAVWRLLHTEGLWSYPRFPITDQAVYKRLDKAGVEPLLKLLRHITALLHDRLSALSPPKLAPFASGVYALDETTLDAIARKLPALKGEEGPALPGKLTCLFNVLTQLWEDIALNPDPLNQDKSAARAMVEALPSGSLILADLGYFSFEWFDWLSESHHFWVSRLKAKTSYQVRHIYFQSGDTLDAIVWLGAYRSDKAAYAVRLVQFRKGKQLFSYMTNVLDPKQLSLTEIARLYARRWDIEMAFQLVKQHLKLHLLWSAKQHVMLQQIVAVLTIAQILTAVRQEIAIRANADIFEVSMALMIQYIPLLAAKGRDPIAEFVEHGRSAMFIRPSTRVKIEAPDIPPEAIHPLPDDLVLTRKPRYANKIRASKETRKD